MPIDNTTLINPLGLWFTVLMGVLIVILPRRFALVPVIILTCYMTMGQRVIIATLDFTMFRILVLFGWIRLIVRGEIQRIRLNAIDKALLLWTVLSILTYTLLWQTPGAFINRLGFAYNAVGFYFLFRFLVRDLDGAKRVFKILAIFVVPLAMLMLIEQATGRNAFAIFGGVPEITKVRDGLLRCQGPFGNPILAGVFGATALPLFVGLWWEGGSNRLLGALAIISSTLIVVTSTSSTPVMAYLAGIAGLALWPLRKHMRVIWWGFVLMVLALAVVMKAPVWYLIARLKPLSASTGYHRAHLIDQAVAHLSEWWLIGTRSTGHWGYHLADVANQYIRVGVDGGLITMILFMTIIALCFRGIGRAIRAIEREKKYPKDQLTMWAMGAALFSHGVTFLGVNYFDQNIVVWYLLLAMISTCACTLVPLNSRLHRVRDDRIRIVHEQRVRRVANGRSLVCSSQCAPTMTGAAGFPFSRKRGSDAL